MSTVQVDKEKMYLHPREEYKVTTIWKSALLYLKVQTERAKINSTNRKSMLWLKINSPQEFKEDVLRTAGFMVL